jgi:hypothetical protein
MDKKIQAQKAAQQNWFTRILIVKHNKIQWKLCKDSHTSKGCHRFQNETAFTISNRLR